MEKIEKNSNIPFAVRLLNFIEKSFLTISKTAFISESKIENEYVYMLRFQIIEHIEFFILTKITMGDVIFRNWTFP